MPNTMDQLRAREECIQRRQEQAIRRYPSTWKRMIGEWRQSGCEPRAWMMYSANYLFRTGDVRWAIDPIRLQHRLPNTPATDYARDLEQLSFVLLTHRHGDHLDAELIRSIKNLPIIWVVPEAMLPTVMEQGGLSASQIIVPQPLEPILIQGVRLTPFEGLHWATAEESEFTGLRGVPETGYLAEFDDKRWLFPGDTRTYDASRLPSFGSVDGLFAHVWLGRGAALDIAPAHLNDFCRFCLDLHARRVILTHLQEFGRALDDYWDEEHVGLVSSKIKELNPGLSVVSARLGESVWL